jgi:hypothetical protein
MHVHVHVYVHVHVHVHVCEHAHVISNLQYRTVGVKCARRTNYR